MSDIDIIQVSRVLSAAEAANVNILAFTVEQMARETYDAATEKLDPSSGLAITMRAQTGANGDLTPHLVHVMAITREDNDRRDPERDPVGLLSYHLIECPRSDKCEPCGMKVPRAILEMRE